MGDLPSRASWIRPHRVKSQLLAALVSVQEAIEALRDSLADKAHNFWADSISFPDAVRMLDRPITGHQQITDAYLVALAIENRGKLATLDRGIARLAPTGVVEVIE